MRVIELVCGVALVVGHGCGKTGGSEDREVTRDPPTTPSSDQRPVRSFDPPLPDTVDEPDLPVVDSVKLENPGAAPRAALRYRPATAGFDFGIRATLEARERIGHDDSGDVALPELRYGLYITAAEPTGDRVRLQVVGAPLEMVGPDTHRAIAEQRMAGYAERVARTRAWIDIDDRGIVRDAGAVGASAPDTDVSDIERLYFDFAIPLPAEPVGAGARWTVVSRVKRGGVIVKRTSRVELVSMRGDVARVRLRAREVGERQVLSSRGLPADVTAELLALVWQLEGDVELDLGRTLPSGALDLDQRFHGRMHVGQPARATDSYTSAAGRLTLETATRPK